jgi:hypothetical protein
MSPESPSVLDRLRAGLAATLAWLAGGARRLEDATSRGGHRMVIGLLAVTVLAVGVVGFATERHALTGWTHGGPHTEQRHGGPGPKPEGKPEMKPAGKPEGRFEGRIEGRRDDDRAGHPVPKPGGPPPSAPATP